MQSFDVVYGPLTLRKRDKIKFSTISCFIKIEPTGILVTIPYSQIIITAGTIPAQSEWQFQ